VLTWCFREQAFVLHLAVKNFVLVIDAFHVHGIKILGDEFAA
jgi:hypothetical protein